MIAQLHNLIKTTEPYTYNWWVSWHINHTSVKLFFKKLIYYMNILGSGAKRHLCMKATFYTYTFEIKTIEVNMRAH